MREYKTLKDPIYGYITIPNSLIEGIVDTAEFQRLRDIIQTSYAPLYSSAVHNRFVHSIGVYYLGTIAGKTIKDNFSNSNKNEIGDIKRVIEIFELACLLHDLGHSPFSHTGEDFYKNKSGESVDLHKELSKLINDKDFLAEIKTGKDYEAKPHEIMSAIVSLKKFDNQFQNDEEKSFFARCIVGYKYKYKKDKKHSFYNCIISMLNSYVIDVDKLDYLIRDAYITGYDTVSIDYFRLLKNIEIIENNEEYKLVFKKGAISVIENVVYARDSEKKWIQTHPVVMYEAFLLQEIIKEIGEKYNKNKLFSYNSLTQEGTKLSGNFKVSLLSDSDIIFLMKNIKGSKYVNEYYNRSIRKHALWKSEPEYKAIFNQGFEKKDYVIVEQILTEICKMCNSQILNDEAIKRCEHIISDMKKINPKTELQKRNFTKNIEIKDRNLKWLNKLKEFAKEEKIPFEFILVNTKQFNSGFSDIEFEQIEIDFGVDNLICKFKDVTNVLKADEPERKSFYYLFCSKPKSGKKINVNKLASMLGELAGEESIKEMKIKFKQ